jgi:hypothetical protein
MGRNRKQLEGRILAVVEATQKGRPQEDSYTELKAELPQDAERASRQLGGHANSANGEPILWVVGIQEDGKVVGARKQELANWLPAVAKRFDGAAPRLSQCVTLRFGSKTILGLLFLTDDLPYVVCKADGSREVPWREGNRTRQAARSELVGLLREFARLPEVDVMDAHLRMGEPFRRKRPCVFQASLYFKPRLGNQVTIPFHDCFGSVELHGSAKRVAFDTIELRFTQDYYTSRPAKDIVIRKAGLVDLTAKATILAGRFEKAQANVEVNLRPVNSMRPVVIRHELAVLGFSVDPWTALDALPI